MSVILTHTEEHAHKMEIWAEYDPSDNTVEGINAIFLDTPVGKVDYTVLFLFTPEMDVAINKIIDRVDWREIYRSQMQDAA